VSDDSKPAPGAERPGLAGADDELTSLRAEIDAVDDEIVALVNRRGALAERVGEVKRRTAPDAPFYRPDREALVLRRVLTHNPGPVPAADVARIVREVMSACLALEQALTVAFLGPWGTFTELAVEKQFGGSVAMSPVESIDAVFREVETGAADYGIVPIENSTEGVVTRTVDRFVDSDLKITGEVEVPIHLCLLTRDGTRDHVTEVLGHPQALAQARQWLDRHLPGVPRAEVASNALAAQRAAAAPALAAVAGEAAAHHYELGVAARNIEDVAGNTTRFLAIGRDAPAPTGADKTSFVFAMPNVPGALHAMLKPLADAGISMSRIESRPTRHSKWDYRFFVDILGHARDPEVQPALEQIARSARFYKWLGSYPRAMGT